MDIEGKLHPLDAGQRRRCTRSNASCRIGTSSDSG